MEGIGGQNDAVEALRFGLTFDAPGHHVFVRAIMGTGRLTLVHHVLAQVERALPPAPDRCYVRNFAHPERPRLISLPVGTAERFRRAVEDLITFLRDELHDGLEAERSRTETAEIDRRAEEEMRTVTDPLDAELAAAGLALMMAQTPGGIRPVLVPRVADEPVPPDKVQELLDSGALAAEDLEARFARAKELSERVEQVSEHAIEIRRRRQEAHRRLLESDARRLLARHVGNIRAAFPTPEVARFLDELVEDVVEHRLGGRREDKDFLRAYRVNVVISRRADDPAPRVVEEAPSVQTLLGSIDVPLDADESLADAHLWIHAGSILRADGGWLVLDARDLLSEPGGWHVLVRTLRGGRLDFTVPDTASPFRGPTLKPEPIHVHLKVVLLGDPFIYHALDGGDLDFPQLFKVLVDVEAEFPRDAATVRLYARMLARIGHDEQLPEFSAAAVAALAEHGARIAAQRGKLTARLARVADIAREAAYLARDRGDQVVTDLDVIGAVRRTKYRANLPARRFQEAITEGSIRILTQGRAVGQINGLAVIHAGPLTYGFPTRISATTAPGSGGAINIESAAHLSGAIHQKSHFILGGLLRNLLALPHPLVFDASIAFEQSYGSVDGDSASAAAICCLLSAITNLPLRQDLAMTGAIDQMGNVLPIGAVNEKIEGFFDTCAATGLTGTQGVVVPAANVGDLMLRLDVVDACTAGRFSVYAVESITEAIELFFDCPAGERDAEGRYPPESPVGRAVARAGEFWRASAPPRSP
jgi:ATP-dependent Lon protease